MRLLQYWKSLLREREGATAIEFSLVVGPLLMLLFGVVKIGEVVWIQNALNYSVAEAARCGSVNLVTCATLGQVQSFAASAAGAGLTSSVFTASAQSCGSDVVATYTVSVNAPFLSFSVPLTAHACYPK